MIGHLDPSVQTALITGGFGLVASIVGYVAPRVNRSWRGVMEVRQQVSNGHATNLRDDIDEILRGQAQLLANQAEHSAQIGDLRTDLEWERRERMDLARIVTGRTPLA